MCILCSHREKYRFWVCLVLWQRLHSTQYARSTISKKMYQQQSNTFDLVEKGIWEQIMMNSTKWSNDDTMCWTISEYISKESLQKKISFVLSAIKCTIWFCTITFFNWEHLKTYIKCYKCCIWWIYFFFFFLVWLA